MADGDEFDFTAHAHTASRNYRDLLPTYERYAEVVKHILKASLPRDASIHSIEARAKATESFERKARKRDGQNPAQPKYAKPLADITDLAGVRVIAYFPKTVELINSCIEREFDVVEKRDIGADRLAQGRFGYQSVHYLVKLTPSRSDLPEYKPCEGLIAEIQVRTILQHAWAEMEHDIQYKSLDQIPTTIQRRFVALAGMLEIADREFQAIQDEDAQMRSRISASLEDDLTKTAIAEPPAEPTPQDESTPIEPAQQRAPAPYRTHTINANRARAFIAVGRFVDAVEYYNRAIAAAPNHHTLYIARAKARFLAGDRSGALKDINHAAAHLPNDEAIPRILRQLEEGVVNIPVSAATDAWHFTNLGNDALERGNGEEAFEHYSKAQELGFAYVYATFNKAMACALLKDKDGAAYFVGQLHVIPGTPMEVNILGLQAIIAVIAKGGAAAAIRDLLDRVRASDWFDYRQSPLRHLEVGLQRRDTTLTHQLTRVFDLLKLPQGQSGLVTGA